MLAALLWVIAGLIALACVLALAVYPGIEARRRKHPRAGWIAALGLLGIVCLPLWFVALGCAMFGWFSDPA